MYIKIDLNKDILIYYNENKNNRINIFNYFL